MQESRRTTDSHIHVKVRHELAALLLVEVQHNTDLLAVLQSGVLLFAEAPVYRFKMHYRLAQPGRCCAGGLAFSSYFGVQAQYLERNSMDSSSSLSRRNIMSSLHRTFNSGTLWPLLLLFLSWAMPNSSDWPPLKLTFQTPNFQITYCNKYNRLL